MSRSPLTSNQIAFTRYTVSVPGVAQQLNSILIPDGFKLTLKARLSNTGNIYLAPTAAAASSSSGNRKVLEAGENITVELDNTNRLYMDADNATDVLEVTILAPSS